MSIEKVTNRVFDEMLPELASMTGEHSKPQELATEILGLTGTAYISAPGLENSDFWNTVGEMAAGDSRSVFDVAIGHETEATHKFPDDSSQIMRVRSTGKGALLAVDGAGVLQVAHIERNDPVEQIYGDIAKPIVRKLVLAVMVEKIKRQGADWGDGYACMTEFLQQNGLMGRSDLPPLGMSTVHSEPLTTDNIGHDRGPLAYAAASSVTLDEASKRSLLELPSFADHHDRSIDSGVNEIDWLVGLADYVVARAAAETIAGTDLSENFPNPVQDLGKSGWFGVGEVNVN